MCSGRNSSQTAWVLDICLHCSAWYVVVLFFVCMNTVRLLLALVLCSSGAPSLYGIITPFPSESITALTSERAQQHLEYLASDELMGRNTPSPYLDTAAAYIAAKFQEYGLAPVNGTYFHRYELQRTRLGDTSIFVVHGHKEQEFVLKSDFIPFRQSGSGTLRQANITFVGYGITAPEYGYDDYASIDIQGNIAVILKGEPRTTDSTIFNGLSLSPYAEVRSKIANARLHGAAAVVLIADPRTTRNLRPVGFAWPSLYPHLPADALPLRLPDPDTPDIPVLDAGENIITALFGSVDSLSSIQKTIDTTLRPHSFLFQNTTADINLVLAVERYTVSNVMGILPGKTLPQEFVVLGAHYDHVGYFTPGPNAAEMNETENETSAPLDSIYNGADDNASGTTGLLLAAEAFARAPQPPNRSMLFLAFSGEEKGLLGSRAFVNTSPIPLPQMVAMLNMDMIGRNSSDSLSIGGNTRSPELSQWNEQENQHMPHPFALAYNIEKYFFRSDQANFAKHNIPVLFYHSGEHDDYHRVTDGVEKINYTKLLRTTELCARVAWRVANERVLPTYTPAPDDNE